MNAEQLLQDPPEELVSEAPEKEIVENLDKPHADSELRPEASMHQKIAMLTAVILPLLGVVVAIVLMGQIGMVSWEYVAMLIGGWLVTTLGITIGFHRLCSHKAFDTYPWVRLIWTALGTMSVEGAPLTWCAVHRRHHSHSDKEGDPHSPNLAGHGLVGMVKGLFHGQIGWLFTGYWSKPNYEKWIPDLIKDKMLVRMNDHYYLLVLLSLGIPTALGFCIEGWFGAFLGFLWGGLVRVFVTHHITWSINSICHVFGKRDYKSSDHSTNNVICGVLACGEGWH
ncbi:MAG: fatty acid desaturase, partial [Planctomycetota bacterium]